MSVRYQEPTPLAGEALRPIASLISKSEKARRKLAPGTWQHAMLRDNLKALRLAAALMGEAAGHTSGVARDEMRMALRAFAVMIRKAEKARAGCPPGTSQRTLQQNRLKALRMAGRAIRAELATRSVARRKGS